MLGHYCRALAEAQTAYCEEGSDKTLTASVNGVVNATGEIIISVLMKATAKGSTSGPLASGCAGSSYAATLQGANQAVVNAFGDASAVVMGSNCPGAVAKLKKASGLLKDSVKRMYKEAAASCAMVGTTRALSLSNPMCVLINVYALM